MTLLAGKVALVTGGTSGVGETTALMYAESGAKVVIAGRNEERGDKVVKKIQSSGGDAVFFQGDVTSEEDVKRMIAFTIDTYGRLDCAFNNAGISGPIKKLIDVDLDEWQHVQKTNLTSMWLCMKYEIIQMIKQGGGSVVNHASISGQQGMPYSGPYAASKHAIIGITKTAALESCDDGVRVNVVCPGPIDTPLLRIAVPEGSPDESILHVCCPMHRIAKCSEVAELVIWLSSPKSSFITGQDIAIDGGETAGRYMQAQG